MQSPRWVSILVAGVVLVGCASPSPGASASPVGPGSTEVPTASAKPTATAQEPTSAELEFATLLMGNRGRQSSVHAVTAYAGGILAVGVEYEGGLPNLGPVPPHEGRVWWSADGWTWEDVTPVGVFTNVALSAVIRRADGTLLAVGTLSEEDPYGGVSAIAVGGWESEEGRTWAPTQTGIPADRWIRSAAQGEQGVLVDAWQVGDTHGSEIWFSADGRTWELVRRFNDGLLTFDAGREGFVIAGREGLYGEPGAPFAIASANGREWFESTSPPADAGSVASVGPDWVLLSVTRNEAFLPSSIGIWRSANGLDWSGPQTLELDLTDENDCPVEPSLESAGTWLVLRSRLSGLCSEGGYVNYGPHQISFDAGDWTALPFPQARPGETGSWVGTSAVVDGKLVLAGELNRRAVFWRGKSR